MIAGYHWFTDWGRDTMISLGADDCDRTRAEAATDPEDVRRLRARRPHSQHVSRWRRQGLYHTADATLWFFHAVERYLAVTDDGKRCASCSRVLRDIIDASRARHALRHPGRPADGLLDKARKAIS